MLEGTLPMMLQNCTALNQKQTSKKVTPFLNNEGFLLTQKQWGPVLVAILEYD